MDLPEITDELQGQRDWDAWAADLDPALDAMACQHIAETTDRKCGRTIGVGRFMGLTVCKQHLAIMRRRALYELERNPGWRREVEQELRQLDEWRDDELRTPHPETGESVYFLKRFQFVKIGYARNVQRRIKEINAGSAIIPGMVCVPVKLLATIPGGCAKERALHQRFSRFRVGGEWFVLSHELQAFIAGIGDDLWARCSGRC